MFTEAYARAREDGADALADEIIDIADGVAEAGREDSARVNAARLAVDARKWVAAKLKPKSYAERVEQGLQVTVSGEVKHTITDEQRALALDAIIRRQMVGNASSLNEAVKMLSGPQTSAMPAMPAMIDVTPTSSEQTSQTSTTNPDQTERGPATKRG